MYPNGHGQTWNAGNCCGRPNVTTDNEVNFVSALITRLSAGGRIDASRIYVTGFSAGAAMTYTLACRLSDRIAAIAPVAGTMDLATCNRQNPVSVMEIHGTLDLELLYGGGVAQGSSAATPSTPSILQRCATLDGCTDAQPPHTHGSVEVMEWTGCSGSAAVQLQTVNGGTHNWYSPQLDGADGSIDATQVVWAFLSAHHRAA